MYGFLHQRTLSVKWNYFPCDRYNRSKTYNKLPERVMGKTTLVLSRRDVKAEHEKGVKLKLDGFPSSTAFT